MPCITPVALIVFNRPQLAAQVFAAIRQAQPPRLFLIADGPRNSADELGCEACRALAAQVDWPCKVDTNFASVNLGCGRRPATGIDWVFSLAEEAIILEDDCVPSPSFFSFCDQMLERYRQNNRVMHVSGDNFDLPGKGSGYSYRFSKYTPSWGWATWRRAWQHYDYYLKTWEQFKASGALTSICPDPIEAACWEKRLKLIHDHKRDDAWDYQWTYAVWSQRGLSVIPAVNLVRNIGTGPDATHTADKAWLGRPAGEIGELRHPPAVVPDADADLHLFNEVYGGNRWRARRTWRYRLSKPQRWLAKLRTKKA